KEWMEALVFAAVAAAILRTFLIEAYRIPTGSMEDTLLAGDFLFVTKFTYGATIPFTDLHLPALRQVEQGDIVVFKYPQDKDVNYIKRCVAVAGSTLEVRDKKVLVDGKVFPLPPQGKFIGDTVPLGQSDMNIFPKYSSFNKDNYGPIKVPKAGDVVRLDQDNFYLYKDVIQYEGHSASLYGNQVLIDNHPEQTYTITQDYYFMMGDNRDNSLDSRYWGFLPTSNVVGSALIVFWSWDPDISLLNPIDKISTIRWNRPGQLIR
ncbi:MAG: signal peptidase I, partial [Chlorobiales bacterium]|nr:signal peptidase I [Chlorobiales bacterium]